MNEMIDQLAEQCYVKTGSSHTDHFAYWKFAELIVKECLNELCEQMDKHNVDLSNLPSWYKALAKTEEHFGVKDQSVCGNE